MGYSEKNSLSSSKVNSDLNAGIGNKKHFEAQSSVEVKFKQKHNIGSKLKEINTVIEEESDSEEDSEEQSRRASIASRRRSIASRLATTKGFSRTSSRRYTDKPRMSEGLQRLRVEKPEDYDFLEMDLKPVRIEDKLIDHVIQEESVCLRLNINGVGELNIDEIKIEGIDLKTIELDISGQVSNLENANTKVREAVSAAFLASKQQNCFVVREHSFMFLACSELEIDCLRFEIEQKLKSLKNKH